MSTDNNYDYAPAGSAPSDADTFDWDNYSFLPIDAAPDADAIEAESASREFRDVEPGEHLLFIREFVGRPESKLREGYLNSVKTSWEVAQVTVRLAKVGDPQASIRDFFDLPPRDPRQMDAYLNASKGQDGGNPGFGARKFVHFLSRIGFPFPEGKPIPAEACKPGNWVGRQVHATVDFERPRKGEQPRFDQRTGMPYPPRVQVKLFSYRASDQTIRGTGPAPMPAATAPPSHARQGQVAQQTRQAAPAGRLASLGLDDNDLL